MCFTVLQLVNMKKGFMKMEKSSGLPVEVHASSVYARWNTHLEWKELYSIQFQARIIN